MDPRMHAGRARPGRGPAAGFTLVEFLVAMSVLAIVSVTALPSFEDFRARQRLRSAADNLYTDLQYARSEAVQRNARLTVSFATGGGWCYGIVEGTDACDCTETDPDAGDYCAIKRAHNIPADGVREDFPGVSVSSASFDGSASYRIDPRRGQVLDAAGDPVEGSILLAGAASRSVRADVNAIGRVRLCSPDGTVTGYPTCPE